MDRSLALLRVKWWSDPNYRWRCESIQKLANVQLQIGKHTGKHMMYSETPCRPRPRVFTWVYSGLFPTFPEPWSPWVGWCFLLFSVAHLRERIRWRRIVFFFHRCVQKKERAVAQNSEVQSNFWSAQEQGPSLPSAENPWDVSFSCPYLCRHRHPVGSCSSSDCCQSLRIYSIDDQQIEIDRI